MEEAIVDVALDLNLLPPGSPRQEVQQEMYTDHRDQAQLLATVPQAEQASTPIGSTEQPSSSSQDQNEGQAEHWPQNRAARVENLRQCVADGTYQVDSAELARSILRNATRFVETC